MLGGFPWEAGRMSVYAAWMPMIGTIILFFAETGFSRPPIDQGGGTPPLRRTWGILFAVLLLSLISTVDLSATVQWWTEIILLSLFTWVTMRSFDRGTVARWIVYAILPHALLGMWQSFSQVVIGSKWLGMASQDPLVRGVSVVEAMGQRWLRVYGGFPHPNIFGGWLVVGMAAVLEEVKRQTSNVKTYLILVLFSACLVLTFSRSAWLAACLMVVLLTWNTLRSKTLGAGKTFFIFLMVMILAAGVTVAWRWPLFVTRTVATPTRLEVRSIDERALSLQNGWLLFRRYPWLGVGPRATGYALVHEQFVPANTVPVIPHSVILLILDEMGIVGCVLLFVFLWCLRSAFLSIPDPRSPILFIVFLPIFLLDHYAWSTWSGLCFFALIFCFVLAKKPGLDTPSYRLAIYQHRD